MMISYLFKRLIRSWNLFLSLLISVILASTFFAGVNIGADTLAKEVLDRQLSQIPVDIRVHLTSILSSNNLTRIVDEIVNPEIEGVTHVELISRLYEDALLPASNKSASFRIVGILKNSRVYDGLTVVEGAPSLEENETYVWIGSENVEELEVGDVLRFNITTGWTYGDMKPHQKTVILNLTVKGFVDVEEQALKILRGYYYEVRPLNYRVKENILIVDWEKTLAKIIDAYPEEFKWGYVSTDILIFLDRESVINCWDIDGSLERIDAIKSQVLNRIHRVAHGGVYVSDHLKSTLMSFRFISQGMRLSFIITSLPVFFIAWYMGTTVSDVSYNLRRREIGLLLTKGFSRPQLLRMFLGEAVLIGLVGGLLGIGLGFALTPFFIQGKGHLAVTPVARADVIAITFIFSVSLALLAVFRPARRASKLDVVDALQEYRYVEEVKPYKKKWPWIAFLLGAYKIVIWLSGFNLHTLLFQLRYYNILIMILLAVWVYFDTFVLNYVGPILFFWGFTKIFIRGSLKFQELVAKFARLAGDLAALSIKNVRRNPARTAAIAFLIAMITGYSFQVIGTHASTQDYIMRQIRFYVGSDVSVYLTNLQNLSATLEEIRNVTGVSLITVEYTFYGYTADGKYRMRFVAVNPEEWLKIAYYEESLFQGKGVPSMFQEMQEDNNTIILDRGVAEMLKLKVGDSIAVKFSEGKVFNLKVVGFFGPERTETLRYPWRIYYWSYVPEGFYNSVRNGVSSSGRILLKLVAGADGEAVAEEIRNLDLSGVSAVYSVAEILRQWRENSLAYSYPVFLGFGSIEIQRLGVAFAVLAASAGTVLVTLASLRERRREIGMMSVKGLSFRQIVGVLLTDTLAVVGFAVFLGAVVGLIVVHGNISAANAMSPFIPGPTNVFTFAPILRRMVFPLDSVLALSACCSLIFMSTVIPVLLAVKKYISEIERVVREV